jgi:IMP cyclohydrolase
MFTNRQKNDFYTTYNCIKTVEAYIYTLNDVKIHVKKLQ